MSGTAAPGTPAVGGEPTGAAQTQESGAQTSAPPAPVATPPAAPEPDIYDTAFAETLGPNAKEPVTEPEPASTPAESPSTTESQQSGEPSGNGQAKAELSDDQVQMLRRQHIEPEMIAGWSEAQRTSFFENGQKREADQTTSYKRLSEQLDELTKRVDQGGQSGDQQAGQGDGGQQGTPASTFAGQAQKVSDQLVEDFGSEIGDAGKLMVEMGSRLDEAMTRLDDNSNQIQQSQGATKASNQVIVELTLENGLSDLVGDYPSLSKDAVRQQVIEKFETEWKSKDNPHRTGKGPILKRIKAALASAAKSELGTLTESAAQVALANTTKERLKNQPTPGHARGQALPKSEDEMYAKAFNDILRPEIKGA